MTLKSTAQSINTMEGMIEAGLKTLEEMKWEFTSQQLEQSFGIVLLEAIQVGFLVTAGMGTGILLRHDKANKSWSPPIAVGLSNVGAGFSVGLERKHMIILLSENEMMQTMASNFSFRLGLDSSIAAGTIGQELDITGQVGDKGRGALISAYTYTRGAYVGVEVQGAALAPRGKVNQAFYGEALPTQKVLFGVVENMPECEPLDRLHAKLHEIAETPMKIPPSYVETIARPFVKNTDQTNMMKE